VADPTLSATVLSGRPSIQLIIDNVDASAHTVTVTRTAPVAGLSVVRWASEVELPAGDAMTVIDDEAPIGATFSYTLYSDTVAVDTAGPFTFSGPWTVDGMPSWAWLRHLTLPSLSIAVVVSSLPSVSRPGRAGTFLPMGAALPVMTAWPRGGRAGDLSIISLSNEHTQAIIDLLADGSAIQFAADPRFGVNQDGLYMAVTDLTEERPVDNGDDEARIFTLTFTEVAAPPPIGGQGALHTYQEVLDAYATYTQVRDLGSSEGWTYRELLTQVTV